MHPELFEIGSFQVHTYGFLIAIGFLVALGIVRRLAIRAGLEVDRILDLAFWCFLVGFVGARLLFVITRWDYFRTDPAGILRIWEGGLVFFGGPLAVLPFLAWYLRKFRLPSWSVADVLAPGLVIAHMFGRLGCLAAGCCYGKPTDQSWGIHLESELVESSLRGLPLHPAQLYEAGALLVLFFGLLRVFKKRRFEGQVALTYFTAYPLIRSVIEVFRGDSIRGFVIPGVLSTSQFISLMVFSGAVFFMKRRLREIPEQQGARV